MSVGQTNGEYSLQINVPLFSNITFFLSLHGKINQNSQKNEFNKIALTKTRLLLEKVCTTLGYP